MNYKIKNIKQRKRGYNFSAVISIIIVSVALSIIGFVLFAQQSPYIDYLALKPSNIAQGKWYYLPTLLTHVFLHGGIGHLLINMFVLFSLGNLCEKIIGKKRFIWFYLLSGIFAAVLSVILTVNFGTTPLGERIFGGPATYMVGASGAIFALAGLYVILLPRLKFMIIFLPFFSLPAKIMVPLVLFLMWGLSIAAKWPIGNVAHFGGFLAGIIYGIYLKNKYEKKVERLQKMFA